MNKITIPLRFDYKWQWRVWSQYVNEGAYSPTLQ